MYEYKPKNRIDNPIRGWDDQFYTAMENGIAGYKRPADWKERADRLDKKHYKPAGHNYD